MGNLKVIFPQQMCVISLKSNVCSTSAEAVKLETLEKVIQNPSLFLSSINPEAFERAKAKMKVAMAPVRDLSAAQAETYTVEYDEFVKAVRAAGKVKIGGAVVENPSDSQLLEVKMKHATALFV